jgi:hypothetical protein
MQNLLSNYNEYNAINSVKLPTQLSTVYSEMENPNADNLYYLVGVIKNYFNLTAADRSGLSGYLMQLPVISSRDISLSSRLLLGA